MTIEHLHFKIEGRLTKILGRQSVSTEMGAVFELVKNSYDADAPTINIAFDDILKGVGRIKINDTGIGMTKDDFENKFMVIATRSRVDKTVTDSGRRVIGEKGIGRFAMETLSKRTTIISYPKESSTGYKLTIDWEKYEEKGVSIDQVGNEFTDFEKDPKKQGLEIILEGLRSFWDLKKIDKLIAQLGSLITPEGFESKLPFEISLSAQEYNIKDLKIESKLLKKAMYKMKAVLSDNKIHVTIWERNKKVESDELIRDVIEPASMRCGKVTYWLYGFPRGFGDEEQEEYEKYYGMVYESKMQDFLENNHGIRIYKDNFRMRPYGEPGNDWTERGEAARLQSGVLPNKSLVGWINLNSDDNPSIIATSTREKLIENDAFEDLRSFVREANKVLDHLCHKRRVEKRKKQVKDLAGQIEIIAKKLNKLELSGELKPRQQSLVRDLRMTAVNAYEFIEETKKEKERLMSKLEASRSLATVGLTTGLVAHEVRRDLGDILAIATDFRDDLEKKTLTKDEILRKTIRLYSATIFVSDYMSLVRSFTSALRSKQPEFRKKAKINLREGLFILEEKVSPLLNRYNIKMDYEQIPKNLNEFYMFEADFQSIFLNLITNSLKAIQKQRKGTDDFQNRTKQNVIKISLSDDPKNIYLQILFSDDGPGVNPKIANKIFDAFVSDTDESDEWAAGSGLGLPFVREILQSYDGDIELTTSEFEPGATFLLKIKWDEVKKE